MATLGWRTSSAGQRLLLTARHTSDDKYDGWFECATCGQDFTGAMQLGLAEAWWSKARRLPKKDEERLAAANNLAITFYSQAKYAEAEKIFREVLAVQMRTIDREHENTLATKAGLARSLAHQGKNDEAERIRREVLVVRQRVFGLEHPKTLTSTEEIASILIAQGKYAEAETVYVDPTIDRCEQRVWL